MPVWEWVVDLIGVLLLLTLCFGVYLVLRRRWISRHGGTFELSNRVRSDRAGRGWVLGLGRYVDGHLEWFRIFSPWPRPTRVWRRDELELLTHREPTARESFALYAGHVIVGVQTADGAEELAMSRAALTGFQSWLEAAPPGTDWTVHTPR